MSREVRRVPLDFAWPIDQVWDGYQMPTSLQADRCPDCSRGMTAAREWLDTLCTRIDMLASDITNQRRGRPMHPWLAQMPYPAHSAFVYDDEGRTVGQPQILRPSADILDLVAGLSDESPECLTNPMRGSNYKLTWKVIEAAGLDNTTWGICPTCAGYASVEKYPGQRAEAETWEKSDPPTGEGWQLWETVSEGSPQSPVFATADGLATWMSDPARGEDWVPPATAAAFIKAGWAPTGAHSAATGVISGVELVGHHLDDPTNPA
jgi:hypothetical protein